MTTHTLQTIGILKSCWRSKFAAPRQGLLVPSSRGSITVTDGLFLKGLQNFSHCWLIFIFDQPFTRRPLIKPPKLNGQKIGIFASRSPHRPNPIGLSAAKIESIDGPTLHVSGIDIIDGTHILDIKPYHPLDKIEHFTYPEWLPDVPGNVLTCKIPVFIPDIIKRSIEDESLYIFTSHEQFWNCVAETLVCDPRTRQDVQRHNTEKDYVCFIDNFIVKYHIRDHVCRVISVDRRE